MKFSEELIDQIREALHGMEYVHKVESENNHYEVKAYELGGPKRVRIDVTEKPSA